MSNELNHFIELFEELSHNGPSKIGKLSDDIDGLHSQSADFARLVAAQQQEVIDDFDQLNQSFDVFQKTAVAEEGKLSDQLQQFEDRFQHWRAGMEDAKQEVSLELQGLDTLNSQIRARLQERRDHCQATGQQTIEAARQAQLQALAHVQSFQAAMGQVKNDYDEMATALEQTKSGLARQVESLTQQMQEAQRRSQMDLASVNQGFDQRSTEWCKALDDLLHSNVLPFQDRLAVEIEGLVDHELKELVTKAADYLRTALRGLIDALAHKTGQAAGDRSAIKEIITEIEFFIENLDLIAKRIVTEASGDLLGGFFEGVAGKIGLGGPLGAIGGMVVGEIAKDEVEESLD